MNYLSDRKAVIAIYSHNNSYHKLQEIFQQENYQVLHLQTSRDLSSDYLLHKRIIADILVYLDDGVCKNKENLKELSIIRRHFAAPILYINEELNDDLMADALEAGVSFCIQNKNSKKSIMAYVSRAIKEAAVNNIVLQKAEKIKSRLRTKKNLVEVLQRIAMAANEAYSENEAMHICLSQICNYTNWPIGHVYCYNDKDKKFYSPNLWYVNHRVKYKSLCEHIDKSELNLNHGVLKRLILHKKPQFCTNITNDDFLFADEALKKGIKAIFTFPVLVQSKVLAIFEFFSTEAKIIDDDLIEAIANAASQIGRVIERKNSDRKLKIAKEDAQKANILLKKEGKLVKKINQELVNTTVSKEYVDSIFESITNMLIVVDNNGKIVRVNKATKIILGYREEEIINQDYSKIFVVREDFDFLKNNFETRYLKKDGGEIFVLFSWGPVAQEYSFKGGYIFVAQDISSIKKIEYEKSIAEGQLHQLHKMETIGSLAGGIAHDFNNMLVPILGLSDLILTDLSVTDPNYESIKQIFNAAEKSKALVEQILIFSRQIEEKRQKVDIEEILNNSLKLLQTSVPSNVMVKINLDNKKYYVAADPTHIQQIIINLCTNALQAMQGKGGLLEISLKQQYLGSDYCSLYPNLHPGWFSNIMVKDEGGGIDEQIITRIFNPFFTTKQVGTGIGLSVIQRIINNYGGNIDFETVLNEGSVFSVNLPLFEEELARDNINNIIPINKEKFHERILLIDDESYVLDTEKRILEKFGYKVETYKESTIALNHFMKNAFDYDIVVTDYMMPILNGMQMIERMQQVRKIPVIIATGYSDKLAEEKYEQLNIRKKLMKPLLARDLNNALRDIFDKA